MQDKSENFKRGLALQLDGKFKEAQKIYKELIKENFNNDKLMFLLGTSYLQTKDYDKAIDYLNSSIKLNPNLPDAYNNRGIAFSNKKLYQKSIEDYNKALNLNKKFFDAYLNKGVSLRNIRQEKLAIECFKNCIKLNPKNPKIYNNLGNIYKDLNEYQKAIEHYSKAIQLDENHTDAYFNRGNLFLILKHINLAIKDYEKIIKSNYKYDFLYGNLIYAKMITCDWSDYFFLKKKIELEFSEKYKTIKPFQILLLNDNQTQHKIVAENYSRYLNHYNLNTSEIIHKKNKKIKIGYFSGDFADHAIVHVILDVFKNHDKSKFEIYGFYHGKKIDKYTNEVTKYFDKFFNVDKLSEEEVAVLSRKNKIDIAIDLTGYTGRSINKTFCYRAAPIQINYLGYPGTMGNNFHDYIIADKYVLPPEEYKNFSEKVLYLPNCYQPNQSKIGLSKKNLLKKDFNLPKDYFIFACFNNSFKINPPIFESWMLILKNCKKSVLWLRKKNDECSKNLKKEAKLRGIDPERLIFAKRAPADVHVKRLQFIDLFLDTFPYGAHSTASEMIRMGIPIITIRGKSFSSRVAASMLSNIGLKELIVENIDEYVKIAIEVAQNKKKFKKFKDHISKEENLNNFFNAKKFTIDLEKIYLEVFGK